MNQKNILLLYILIIILLPILSFSQYDILQDDFMFGSDTPETLSDKIINETVGAIFDDDNILAKIELFGNRVIFDMCGNYVFYGYPFLKLNYSKYNNNIVDVYGGRWRKEFRVFGWDTRYLKFSSAGIQFQLGKTLHTLFGGERIPLFFTPYTLKKINLFGIRYDMEAGVESKSKAKSSSGKSKKTAKEEPEKPKEGYFKLKSFVTTRFKLNNYDFHEGRVPIEFKDRIFYAARGQLDMGRTHSIFPPFLKGQFFGFTFVNQELRNGFMSDQGSREDFLSNFTNDEGIINYERMFGVDLGGKIHGINYYFEIVNNNRSQHQIQDLIEPVITTTNTYMETNRTTSGQLYSANAVIYSLNSHDLIKGLLEQPKFEINFEGWYIDKEYQANWAVDDDDDNDGFFDEDTEHADPYFPYEAGDMYYNEPQAGVIYRKYNRNQNDVPDYDEDFLLFHTDRYFHPTIIFEDANYNGIMDYEENDMDPDFPYDRNRKGIKGYFGVNPYNIGLFFGGGSFNNFVSKANSTNNSAQTYIYGYKTYQTFFDTFGFKSELIFERVKDEIVDNYTSLENYLTTTDNLMYKDNSIYKYQILINWHKYRDMVAEVKMRHNYNKRHFDKGLNKFSRYVFKIGYDYNIKGFERLIITPQFKFEKGNNLFYDSDSKEIFVTSSDIINDQREDFYSRVLILIGRYNFSKSVYLISGIQSKQMDDLYFPEQSSHKLTSAIQFVVGSAANISRKSKKYSFMTGYKYIREKFNQTGKTRKEDTMFASFMIAI